MRCFPLHVALLLVFNLTAAPPANREGAIRQLVQNYLNARDQNDSAALRNLFVSDADQLVSSGEWRKGRDAVVTGTLQSSQRTGGKRTITVESVRFITDDTAVADGRYELTGLSGSETRHMWSTFILVRASGGWRIAAIRNMLPGPAGSREVTLIHSLYLFRYLIEECGIGNTDFHAFAFENRVHRRKASQKAPLPGNLNVLPGFQNLLSGRNLQ